MKSGVARRVTVRLVRSLTRSADRWRGASPVRPSEVPLWRTCPMNSRIRIVATAGLALVGALACQSKPSPQLQARIDSLQNAANERDRLVQEMAQDARMISDVSAELAKVQVRGKLNVTRSEERRVGKECRSRWSQ